jgi:polysaccharide pyruvyl transferase WcaK-like protein
LKIELLGVNRQNKGAELMMLTLIKLVEEKGYYPVLGVGRGNIGYSRDTKRLAIPALRKKGYTLFLPDIFYPFFRMFGYNFCGRGDVAAILDASGFAYSSSWGESTIRRVYREVSEWKKMGKDNKYIMMPQAFGPFENASIKSAIRDLVSISDACFPRDSASYGYLVDAGVDSSFLTMSPDFTCLMKPDLQAINEGVCLIPNYRMLDKQSESEANMYLNKMRDIMQKLSAGSERMSMLIHDTGKDLELARKILNISSVEESKCPIICESDPIEIKSIISRSKVVVGSRYHGLASALSTGVPVVCMGWSHKYEYLLKDYKADALLNEVKLNGEVSCLDRLINDHKFYESVRVDINSGADRVVEASESMLSKVWSVVESRRSK